jgi:hypothetical protein
MKLLKLPGQAPPWFIGKWRLTSACEFMIDGKIKKECTKFYFDLFEV